ncbi:uncharacterized protein BKCO1_5000077 [Diplodia corticola]|uniref:Uncharacterized protein n=1 Tax=Diplodia corticola TaxID=236234 RepID=A0A1J9RTQ7_9PEZI|nr:uncharacterized protein BKCO1_5000077 [Diplodia corticola]OJD31252.1 hypothetical protein BKCO1_5000077 [Diplodia corticola]
MAVMSPELRAASWLRLVVHPSTESLGAVDTPYSPQSAAGQVQYDDLLTPLAALLQCRLDVLNVTEKLEKADSWAVLNSSQTHFSQLRARFRTSMKSMSGGVLSGSLKVKVGDIPFGKVQWENAYADSDGDRTATDESEDESIGEQSDEADDDDYESDVDGDESAHKAGEVSGPRLQRNRQMHVLHNMVTLCRLARMIAGVEQRSAELLAKGLEGATCAGDTRARVLAQLKHAGDEARASWAREMQREVEVAERYRVATIQVLQDELRR